MKKILNAFIMSGLAFGTLSAADVQKPQSRSVMGRLSRQARIMQRGLAAAKKRHIQRQQLTKQELRDYHAALKRLGGLAALFAAIGIGALGVRYEMRRREKVRQEAAEQERIKRAAAQERAEVAAANNKEPVRGEGVSAPVSSAGPAEALNEGLNLHDMGIAKRLEESFAQYKIQPQDAIVAFEKFKENEWDSRIFERIFEKITGEIPIISGGYYFLKMPRGRSIGIRDLVGDNPDEDSPKKYVLRNRGPIKAAVKQYKIHLMPKAEDYFRVLAKLYSDRDLRNEWSGIKVRPEIDTIQDERTMPTIVIYSFKGADATVELLNKICALVGDIEGTGITPRFNVQITSLIFVAQGNGDDKGMEFHGSNPFIGSDGSEEGPNLFEDVGQYKRVYYSEALNKAGENPNYKVHERVTCLRG